MMNNLETIQSKNSMDNLFSILHHGEKEERILLLSLLTSLIILSRAITIWLKKWIQNE
jgi:hypothetical protein